MQDASNLSQDGLEDSAPLVEPRRPGNNLPLQLTSFVGRGRETEQVRGLLEENRLLTLSGPGGSGKTRLALAIASEVAQDFEGGAWLVELASLSDPDLVPQAVASVLGVRGLPGGTLLDSLCLHLGPWEVLLVLDNCEHLVDACASLAEALLRSCPRLRILATSRETLGVPGETLFGVPPLSLPDPHRLSDVESLARYEATGLFVERARAVKPDFSLTTSNAPAVAQICYRLDGIPLAIELAAARTRVLAPEQISARLDEGFAVLGEQRRSATPRQQTLRATMDWSYGLLSKEERTLFRRLSVFAGGCTLEEAEAVGTGDGAEYDVLDTLSGLVDKSLLVAEASPGADGVPRYGMLEPIRQYGQQRLEASGEDDRIRYEHAHYYLTLAEETEPGLAEASQEAWLRLRAELDNIRAALGFALGSGRAELGLRLAGALERFWWAGWPLVEGRKWLERGLAGGEELSQPVRARALGAAGRIALWQDDLGPAVAMFEEALDLFKGLGDEHGVAASLASLGHAVLHQDAHERLEALREEAEVLRAEFTDPWALAELLLFLGMVDLHGGDHEQATALLEESMAAFRQIGDEGRAATCATYVWMAALERGDYGRAASLLREDLRRSWQRGIRLQAYDGLLGLAIVAALRDRPERAARLWGSAETLREEVGVLLSLWAHMPTDFQGRLAATRSQLDHDSWEAAWSEGRTITLDRAVEYALEQEEPSLPSTPTLPSYPADLSAREVEVLRLVASGMTNAQVAKELYISPRTVNAHMGSVYHKIGSNTRAEAARFATEHGLL
jgi:predicted ATPase/DNA-binding CsgD family transcriptional regulator